MKKDTLLEDKINRYIGGHMTSSEIVSFEKLLSEDKILNERVQNEALIKLNIKRYHSKKVKERLKVIHNETIHQKPTFNYYILLAIVALLSVLAFYYFSQNEKIVVSNQAIYAQYYERYEIKSDQRNNENDTLDDTFKDYNDGNFEKVIQDADAYLLTNLPASKRLVIGISLMETNDLDRAKKIFQSIIDEKDIIFADQALWYQALAELKDDNKDKSKIILERIANDKNSDHNEDAKNLLATLE